jgi:uncharacterized FAD-dependent dehydrogenase
VYDTKQQEILIVGAGPAGLFAALSLASGGYDVAVVDAGPDIEERYVEARSWTAAGAEHPDYEAGVGGAGLFSDGKLCLSLDVGGHLEHSLEASERQRLLSQIRQVFYSLSGGALKESTPTSDDLRRAARDAEARGLDFKYYPVAHIGTDRCAAMIAGLRQLLDNLGVEFVVNSELVDLHLRQGGGFEATFLAEGREVRLSAEHVLLAMGKVGADRQAALCRGLGVGLEEQPLYLGVRFETEAEDLESLFWATKDPKYSVSLADGSKVKTHCASERGEVIELRYNGLPLAGGHNFSFARSSRSGFSVLWNGFKAADSGYESASGIMAKTKAITDGRLLVQRLSDYLVGRATSPADLKGIDLTCEGAHPGDLRQVLPAQFFEHMDLLLTRIDGLAPTFGDNAVIYGPAIEWWMERVAVESRYMATSIPGLSVCGDGSGWSQGIVHAAATGLLAAEGIAESELSLPVPSLQQPAFAGV